MIAVGIPWQHSHVPTAFMLDLCQSDLIGDSVIIMGHVGDVDANRNQIVNRALEAGADAIFFLDVDQGIPRDVRKRLESVGKPIVSAIAARRTGDCLLAYKEIDWKYRPLASVSGVVEVDGIGFGCVRVDMEVFKKMGKPWFRNYYDDNGAMVLEHDLSFCRKARQLGFSIYVDAGCISTHTAEHKVTTDGRTITCV